MAVVHGMACLSQTLTTMQREKAETAVRRYFSLLSQYAAQPMGTGSLELRDEIVLMFENMYNAPVYNDLLALRDKTNLGASCTIDDYLLSFGVLNDMDASTFRITCDSIVCKPLLEPSYADGYDDMNALVYVVKQIEGGGVSERLTNVIRYNLNADKISYIEKSSFTTSEADVSFLLKNHLGYSTTKLNEMAGRCYQEKKYKLAYLLYEQAAKRDDIDSQFALANMLHKRQGCEVYGEFATKQMTKFWLKKIHFKYIRGSGIKLYNGIWEPVRDMMSQVFKDESEFTSDIESEPFNFGLMKYKVPGKELYGFINMKGKIAIPAKYQYALAFSDGLALVKENGKFGYINTDGSIAIPMQYNDGTHFINGTSTVKNNINGRSCYFVINKKGERISEYFDYIGWRNNKSEMLMVARLGDKWGFVNGNGSIKIPFIYDKYLISNPVLTSSSDHIVSVLKDGKWGFVDISYSEGKILVPPKYKAVASFCYGLALVADDDNHHSYIDKNGNTIGGKYIGGSDFNAFGLAMIKFKQGNEACLINKRGEIVYYCNSDEQGHISDLRRKR